MELTGWNPRNDLFGWNRRVNRIFDNFFFPTVTGGSGKTGRRWSPSVDVVEKDDRFLINAEMPGVAKKDLAVDLKGRVLTLKGERSSDEKTEEGSYYRRERFSGHFERSFVLPEGVDPEAVRADYADGVLKIDIPKPEVEKPKQITVNG